MHSTRPTGRLAVVLLAAGNGARLERSEPKAFVHLGGKPLLRHALEGVLRMREEPQIVVMVPASYVALAREIIRNTPGAGDRQIVVVVGGATRQQSVRVSLQHLDDDVEVVLVHDAARPLTPPMVFDAIAATVRETGGGAIPGLPVTDTIKRVEVDEGLVLETVSRDELVGVQTPQGFLREDLVRAHVDQDVDFTDDAALAASVGVPVRVIAGDQMAFKVTTAWDLRRAEQLMATGALETIRVGSGTDVHAFADDDRPLWLAGLLWEGERGLAGHSDGDVVSHAICDAMLSAARLGTIGEVFGTDDPRFENARGEVFLRATLAQLKGLGLEVGNVSVQVVGNRPVIAKRRREAEDHLAAILGATVSIAGTTTDTLGFTGRGEGVAAIATALLHARTEGPVSF